MSFGPPIVCNTAYNLERDQALFDVQEMVRNGYQVQIRLREETEVSRDKWGSIKQHSNSPDPTITRWALPVIFSPTDKQLEQVGIREQVDCIFHTAMKDWLDDGYTLDTLQALDMIRSTIIIRGATYEFRQKSLFDPYHDQYLYVVMGVNRK